MAGLLDVFNTYEGQQALGLLAAAGPRSDAAGFGQRLAEGLGSANKWKENQTAQELSKLQMQEAQARLQEQQRQTAQEAKLRELAQKFQGRPALAPLVGDPASGILPSAGAPATGFDYNGYAQAMAGIDPMKALALQQTLQKESTINKFDVKDFTPQSVAKYSLTRNYGDLVRMDKAHFANTGGQTVAMDAFTGQPLNSVTNTQSPDNAASTAVTMRGQNLANALGWANHNQSGQRLAFDKAGGATAGKPQYHDGQLVMPPANLQPGQAVPAMASTAQKDAREALSLIATAKEIIPKSTGSWLGAGVDQVGRVFGVSTGGDTAAAQLKALEGALVSKMPKMTGPQSDKDALLYKQMAGEIGDPTIAQSRKLAALQVIEQIQQRHAGAAPAAQPSANPGAATMRWNPKTRALEMVN